MTSRLTQDSDKQTGMVDDLKISLGKKPVFLEHLWNDYFAYIPCISLIKRLCWLSLAGTPLQITEFNSVICILFLDFVRFAILNCL